ncbi:K-box region and MADS-box transcription factor family protein [Tanacetum coccineum]
MGRKKVEMKRIKDKNSRHVIFFKRKTSLFKKARHLSALCGVDVAVIILSSHGKLYQPCSGTTDRLLKAGKEGSEGAKRAFVRLERQKPIQYIQTGSPLGSFPIVAHVASRLPGNQSGRSDESAISLAKATIPSATGCRQIVLTDNGQVSELCYDIRTTFNTVEGHNPVNGVISGCRCRKQRIP